MVSETGKALFRDQVGRASDRPIGIPDHGSFSRWICQNVLGVTDEGEVDEAVSIGGKDGHGIDIFYVDDGTYSGEQAIYIIQVKFSENLDHAVTREEIDSFAGAMDRLRRCPEGASTAFKQKSAFFKRTETQYPNIRKHMILAVAGRPAARAGELIRDDEWRQEKGVFGNNTYLDILDIDKILQYVIFPPTPEVRIRFDGRVIRATDKHTNRDSVTGYVDAGQLVDLSERNRETIFLHNPGQSLGDTAPTHRAVLHTLSKDVERRRFWRLNNGITSICSGLEKITDTEYRMRDFRIVNGRQTLHTLKKSTHPINDVFLLIAVHDTADDDERNQISEATNTQNPIKPADLVTNYGEMIEMAMQCKRDYPEFYFERQTGGFRSAKKSVQNRVTLRRLMDKSTAARSYYAYAIDPNGAMMSDRELFSTAVPNHYDMVFKDRNVRDLIIPHIFKKTLDELHRKWCSELRDDPSDKTARNKGIISKDIVKYYILRFIYESMTSIWDADVRERVRTNMIEVFRNLKKEDPMPKEFLEVARIAYYTFMISFDLERKETWPRDLMARISRKRYREKPGDEPSPYEMMCELKQRGHKLLPHMLRTHRHVIELRGDKLKDALVSIASG